MERLYDFFCRGSGRGSVIFCLERLHDFFLGWRGCVSFVTHSLTHSVCMIFCVGCVIFLWRGCVIFGVERLHNFLLLRGCMFLCVDRFRDFCV